MPELVALDLVVILAVVILIYGGVTQVVVPIFTVRPLFPAFHRNRRLVRELEQAHQDVDEIILEKKIASTRSRAEKLNETAPVIRMVRPNDEGGKESTTLPQDPDQVS